MHKIFRSDKYLQQLLILLNIHWRRGPYLPVYQISFRFCLCYSKACDNDDFINIARSESLIFFGGCDAHAELCCYVMLCLLGSDRPPSSSLHRQSGFIKKRVLGSYHWQLNIQLSFQIYGGERQKNFSWNPLITFSYIRPYVKHTELFTVINVTIRVTTQICISVLVAVFMSVLHCLPSTIFLRDWDL